MEWLFLSCHNYWIVCRLVKDPDHPYLVYSEKISINHSSEPFRAYLGAILSVIKCVSVEPSENTPALELDPISEAEEEEESNDGPYENDNDSGPCVDSSSEGIATDPAVTHRHGCTDHQSTGLMVSSWLLLSMNKLTHLLRLLHLPPTRQNLSRFGFIFVPFPTTRSPFRSVPRMGNNAFG